MYIKTHGGIYFHQSDHPRGTNLPSVHFHNGYELYVLLSGRKRYVVSGNEFDFEAPAAIFLRPAALHRSLSPDDCPHRMAVIEFVPGLLSRYSDVIRDTILNTRYSALFYKPELRFCEEFAGSMERILGKGGRLSADALAARLFEAICELSALEPVQKFAPLRDLSEENTIIGIFTYLEQNLASPIKIEPVAANFGYTPDGLTRLLRRCTGQGWRENLCSLRCEKALRMIIDTARPMSISDIAEKCGFSSENYFGDFIAGRIGIPPSEYRRRYSGVVKYNDPLPLLRGR